MCTYISVVLLGLDTRIVSPQGFVTICYVREDQIKQRYICVALRGLMWERVTLLGWRSLIRLRPRSYNMEKNFWGTSAVCSVIY